MKRYDIIQKYIEKYNYKTYLEVGTQKNATFDRIKIKKTSVDPDPNAGADFVMSSDSYFNQPDTGERFDIIFLDALHESPQLYKDINNSLDHLSEGGTIICHDCNPILEIEQQVPRISKRWNGDVWKDIVRLKTEREDLEIFTIDCDEGCSVIRKGELPSKKLDLKGYKLTYDNLDKNRKYWLDIISVEQWLEMMGENMSYKIWEFIPYGIEDKNYGRSCNEYCELIVNDDDYIVLRDTDCCSLTPSHMHVIKNAIENAPKDTGLLIPYTSRIGQKRQVYDLSQIDNPNMIDHRNIALKLAKEPLKFIELNIPISGMLMIFKKSTWKLVNGFKDGLLGVDTTFSNRIRRAGLKIYLINQLYFMHYYRLNTNMKDTSHLK